MALYATHQLSHHLIKNQKIHPYTQFKFKNKIFNIPQTLTTFPHIKSSNETFASCDNVCELYPCVGFVPYPDSLIRGPGDPDA